MNTKQRECLVCLEKDKTLIDVFGTKGKKLNIKQILGFHFWFHCNDTDTGANDICTECWKIIKHFNDFYNKILQTHAILKEVSSKIKIERDLIHDESIDEKKSETEHLDNQMNVKNEECADIGSSLQVFIEETPYAYEAPTPGNIDVLMTNSLEEEAPMQSTSVDNLKKEETQHVSESEDDSDDQESSDNDSVYDPKIEENPIMEEFKPEKAKIKGRGPGRPKKSNNSDGDKPDKRYTKDQERRLEEEQEIQKVLDIKCVLCAMTFNTFRGCKSHFTRAHNMDGYLICCDTKYYRKKPLVNHVQTHLYPDGLNCPTCNKNFIGNYRLQLHLDIHKAANEKDFKCEKCPKTFARAEPLRIHMLRHAEKTHICNQCPKSYSTRQMLEKHVKVVHDKAYIHICDICARVFRSKAIYEKHKILVHSDVKPDPAQCQMCGAWLKHEASLKAHIKRHHEHEGVRHFCEMCGKESPNATALYMHKKYVHWSEKIHKCTICEKAFKEEKTLREHMAALHTGEMLYSCDYCSKTCNSSATMHKHRKQQHPEEWAAEQLRKSYV